MDFLATSEGQLIVGVAVGLIAIGAAYFLLSSKKPKVCLNPENFKQFKLVKKTQLSHNVAKFNLLFLHPLLGKDSQGEEVIKPYTPTTLDSDVGYFELVIKMYPQGRMSHHFREMREGDYLAVKGPKVARAILENPSDQTKVHLIYANVTYDDILLKDELDSLAKNYPQRFKVYYPPEVWNGGVGFVSKEMIQAQCPHRPLIFSTYFHYSGVADSEMWSAPMNKAMAAHLDALGYTLLRCNSNSKLALDFVLFLGKLPSIRTL
ncbi:NADH--cytochrome reductase 1 [Sesamum angolense]|uniref:NADH--cytochrome reductase 1 n=1 Tax=Sesamum angolense TaxID=2727404 RepID=A0AAE1X4H8_9LAMI|nr:NADH--cytochrome reductase 1 [Sesamum angolense]